MKLFYINSNEAFFSEILNLFTEIVSVVQDIRIFSIYLGGILKALSIIEGS